MYGLVNRAIEEMICEQHGAEAWECIRAAAGVEVEVFISNAPYPDGLTYDLVAAAARTLGEPADAVLERLGEHWVTRTAQQAYGCMFRAAGRTLPEFLANLPGFHGRVSMIYPGMNPPRFECREVRADSLQLHYCSDRRGLAPFVTGLLRGLGKVFGTPVAVTHVASKDAGAGHDVFRVEWSATRGA